MYDKYDRKINYLRISVTDLCNLRCKYCMPIDGVVQKSHKEILSFEEIIKITKAFVSLGIDKIRLTGGEPLVRKDILDLVENISNINGIKDLTLTTNGILLKKYAKELKNRGVSRVNISLDTLNEKKYSQITRGGKLKQVLKGIEEARKVGLDPIKINVVLIGGFNDDEIVQFVNLTKENIDVRFIELMPIGETYNWNLEKFVSNKAVLDKIPELIRMNKEDVSTTAEYFKLPNATGKVGLINPISAKFCSSCNRLRLTSNGKLKLCLHNNEEIDLKPIISSNLNLEDYLNKIIYKKPKAHNLEEGSYTYKNMVQIGG